MRLKLRWSREDLNNITLAMLLIVIWAFNEVKIITYTVKIINILVFGFYCVVKRKTNSKFQYWCLLMMVLSILATLVASDRAAARYTLLNMIQVFLVAYVLYGYVDNENKINYLLRVIVFAGLVLTVRLIIKTPLSVWLSWERLGEAIGSNSNDIGNKAAFSSIIALCLARRNNEKRHVAYMVEFVILAVIVLFSGSRKALLAVVLGVILLYTIGLKDKKKLIFYAAGVALLLFFGYRFIMTNAALYGTIGRRIESMINVLFHGGSEIKSIDLRERYILIALQLIRQHPIFGIGLGNYASASGVGRYSHCDYTEVACSYGLISGFIYYLPLFLSTLRYTFMKRKGDIEYVFLILQHILLFTFVTMVMYTSVYQQIFTVMFVSYYHMKINGQTTETEREMGGAVP